MDYAAAVLFPEQDRPEIVRVRSEPLADDHVLVKMKASGLCHTDLEIIEGSLPYPLPIVLGHEGAGVVEATGKNVSRVKPGDRVIISWSPNCSRCFYCDRNQPILCDRLRQTKASGALIDGSYPVSLGAHHLRLNLFSNASTHAEYTTVPQDSAVLLTADIPFEQACIIGCAVMTAYGAVMNFERTTPDDSVVVVGIGAVGLNLLQAARLKGASRLIAVDIDAGKLAIAKKFGATDLINASDPSALEHVKALTYGRGADVVYEAAGAEQAIQFALEATRPGGNVLLLGKTASNRMLPLRWGSLMGDKHIVRSSYGNARPWRDFPRIAREVEQGRLNLKDLITHHMPLDSIHDGYDAMRAGEAIRAVVTY